LDKKFSLPLLPQHSFILLNYILAHVISEDTRMLGWEWSGKEKPSLSNNIKRKGSYKLEK
jgi:hypothetical protein